MEERVVSLIGAEKDLFLVEIRIKPTNNVKIYIDGDQGVSVEKLVSYNRKLYRQLEEEGVFPDGDFSLELSSWSFAILSLSFEICLSLMR